MTFGHHPWKVHLILTNQIIDNRFAQLYGSIAMEHSEWPAVVRFKVKQLLLNLEASRTTESLTTVPLKQPHRWGDAAGRWGGRLWDETDY